jgi:hypothetical protein
VTSNPVWRASSGFARAGDPQVFTASRRGGDRKPAVRVVLDTLAAGAARS